MNTASSSSSSSSSSSLPANISSAVLVASQELPKDIPIVRGFDFNQSTNYEALFASLAHTGFQATNFQNAVDEVNRMLKWRLSDEPVPADEDDEDKKDPVKRSQVKCDIFMGFTSNMISCGVREIIRFIAQHKLVRCLVTTAGAVEEDLMKCMHPHLMGSFHGPSGAALRKQGINRIGNLLVPNRNYCAFEDWVMPIFDQMLKEQQTGTVWTPSRMIHRFGREINNPDSVWYWCYKNDIPVFCPAITDGSVGDMLYFHSYKNPGLVVDVVQDIRAINDIAAFSPRTGILVLGGGVVKHHVANANLMRNGADYSVFINTAIEYDGSDAGATPDEAISWGKIKIDAKPVKVYGDAALLFPLLASQTFAKAVSEEDKQRYRQQQQIPEPRK